MWKRELSSGRTAGIAVLEYRVGQGRKGKGETTPNTIGNVCVQSGVAVHNSRMKWQKGVAGMVWLVRVVVVVGSSSSSTR